MRCTQQLDPPHAGALTTYNPPAPHVLPIIRTTHGHRLHNPYTQRPRQIASQRHIMLYVVRSTDERDHNTGRFTPPAPTKRHIPISYHCPYDCASPHTPTLRGQSLPLPQYMEQDTSRPTDTSTNCCCYCTWHIHNTNKRPPNPLLTNIISQNTIPCISASTGWSTPPAQRRDTHYPPLTTSRLRIHTH
jgi:hypothetical protein